MSETKYLLSFLLLIYIALPQHLKAQKKEVNKSSIGLNTSFYAYNDPNLYSFSPKLQFSYTDIMYYSIGPLFKIDSNYKTIGLDLSTQLKLDFCRQAVLPIIDWGFQYFKTKSANDSIQKNFYVTTSLGFNIELKYLTLSPSMGFGLNVMTDESDLWFIKLSLGFPKLYTYKSLIQPWTKTRGHSKS